MNNLQDLFQQIELAVVRAADCIQKHNIIILESYFDEVVADDAPEAEPVDPDFSPLCPSFDSRLFEGTFTPKTIAMEFPIMNPVAREVADREKVADNTIHTVTVPLITLAPPASYYIDEVKVRLRVEMLVNEEGEATYILVAPGPAVSEGVPAASEDELGFLEVVIKRGDDPDALTELIRGYDRAVRAQIPG